MAALARRLAGDERVRRPVRVGGQRFGWFGGSRQTGRAAPIGPPGRGGPRGQLTRRRPGRTRSRGTASSWARRGLVLALVALGCALALPTAPAAAHPLGNFTLNQHDALTLAPGRLRVEHVEDLAEIPASQAESGIKRAGKARWAAERCREAAAGSRVGLGGRPVPLAARSARALLRTGQAGLPTVRLECRFAAPLPRGKNLALTFRSARQPAPGWREITARGDRMTLTRTDVPAASPSRALTRYPKQLTSAPPDTTSATLRVRPGGPALAADPAPPASALPRAATDALTRLVARHDLTWTFAAVALGTALLLGALHALAPGHGKTLMAATAAARGTASLRDVLPLAASVTVTHTLGVVALGLLVAGGSAAAPSVVAWLGVASGLLVAGAGAVLVRRAWRHRAHGHGHAHGHSHAQGDAHGHGHGHLHGHGHGHEHVHGHQHPVGQEHPHDHPHPPAPPTRRGTLLLGFAGGLVPSPSAVVVLVGAAALGEAWFGLLLVVAYGAGLALTLTAAGFLVVRLGARVAAVAGRKRAGRMRLASVTRRLAPLGSACVVLALGCGLVFKGAATALG
ncbi:sulfite exporter TauE/SafE family protein [Streptomyces flavofungini]|uniref:sulfite exporter TauE/SafE family protein n=1 Tax=Streptomyces flavofungini TaxID=68200 RepID=UPI001E528420|nr:sulfite exporter TauE/SafE family protein [Streptomyces flavofungini]